MRLCPHYAKRFRGFFRWGGEARVAWKATRWLVADGRSLVGFLRLVTPGFRRSPPRRNVEVRLRVLKGHSITLRPETADVWALGDLVPPAHLPPGEVTEIGICNVWDLGSNIGLTIAHMAVLFPCARILGVEMDEGNAALCRENIRPWRDRCDLLQAAVWHTDGHVTYTPQKGNELGFRIYAAESSQHTNSRTVQAVSLNSLLEQCHFSQPIDYVKMDIEGAESEVLSRNTEWAERVRSIKVEVHPPYTVEECVRDLQVLRFQTSSFPPAVKKGGMPVVVGIRP
jgi:FkbM family methyltransferase